MLVQTKNTLVLLLLNEHRLNKFSNSLLSVGLGVGHGCRATYKQIQTQLAQITSQDVSVNTTLGGSVFYMFSIYSHLLPNPAELRYTPVRHVRREERGVLFEKLGICSNTRLVRLRC